VNELAHGLVLPPCQELEPDEVTYLLGVRYGLKDPKDALKAEKNNNYIRTILRRSVRHGQMQKDSTAPSKSSLMNLGGCRALCMYIFDYFCMSATVHAGQRRD